MLRPSDYEAALYERKGIWRDLGREQLELFPIT
ncbi:hypothetical protein AEGHOMDF_2742 [Methylobacterium soli]|nr:hypothetical protein AEGHOMDF_2742 [Methylobacterium soli]